MPVPSNVKNLLSLQARMLKKFRESGKTLKTTPEDMEEEITNHFVQAGRENTKKWLKRRGFSDYMITKGLVWEPYKTRRGGRVYMRKGLKDIMDFEFYGIPAGTWPNASSLETWVQERVLRRDPQLRSEYKAKTEAGRRNMVKQLAFVFGRAIKQNGMQRYATVNPNEKIHHKTMEKFHRDHPMAEDPPLSIHYTTPSGTRRKITPTWEDEKKELEASEWQ